MKSYRHVSATLARALILGLMLAAQSWAQTWIGNAAAVKQISTITVANTWATGDDAIVTINGKALTVDIGTAATTADVAEAIADAFNASTRLDGTGTPDATSNFGGQEFGEFAEITATSSGAVVTLIGNTAGKPFTFAVSEATAGDGTLGSATTQAATGPNFWNDPKNWDTGVVPANDGTVVFRDSSVPVKYGLPNGSLEVTFQVYMSYSGTIGLPAVNVDNQAKPYNEYRQRYVRLDDAGTGTDIAHRFGLGESGIGCTLCNLTHTAVKCSPVVYDTGTPQITGTKSLNICCTTNTSTLNVLGGSVDYSSQDGSVSAFLGFVQAGGDSRGFNGIHTSNGLVTVSGGEAVLGGSGAIAQITARGGTTRIENQTATISAIIIHEGAVVEYASSATISQLTHIGGVFDASADAGTFMITDADIYDPGCRFLDPNGRLAIGVTFDVFFNPSTNLVFGASITQRVRFSKP